MRDLRRDHRIKRRTCAVCAVSFQSVRRDALYCSLNCRQKAHRAGKVQLFPNTHVGERAELELAIETQDATLAPRMEVQAHAVADVDRRPGQIDSAIKEAAKHGRTNAALPAIVRQRKTRQVLAGEHQREALTLANLKAERAILDAKGRQIEAEATPICHVAEPIGADTDSEWAIRWLLALMVLCCDPPDKAPTVATSARHRPHSDAALPNIMDDVLQVAD